MHAITFNLRTATLNDLESIHAIRRDAILGIASETDAHSLPAWADLRAPDYFAERVAQGKVVIAQAAGEDVGWGSSSENWITGLYVRSAWSGRGVGRGIMTILENEIVQRGYTRALLAASSNAIGFYLKLGYVSAGQPDTDGGVPMQKIWRPSERPPASSG